VIHEKTSLVAYTCPAWPKQEEVAQVEESLDKHNTRTWIEVVAKDFMPISVCILTSLHWIHLKNQPPNRENLASQSFTKETRRSK